MLNKKDKLYPDVAIVVTDVENLKRNLLLFTQIKDLEIPTILVINMADRMEYKGITLDIFRKAPKTNCPNQFSERNWY
jgi:ferrous iron transport protein B